MLRYSPVCTYNIVFRRRAPRGHDLLDDIQIGNYSEGMAKAVSQDLLVASLQVQPPGSMVNRRLMTPGPPWPTNPTSNCEQWALQYGMMGRSKQVHGST